MKWLMGGALGTFEFEAAAAVAFPPEAALAPPFGGAPTGADFRGGGPLGGPPGLPPVGGGPLGGPPTLVVFYLLTNS